MQGKSTTLPQLLSEPLSDTHPISGCQPHALPGPAHQPSLPGTGMQRSIRAAPGCSGASMRPRGTGAQAAEQVAAHAASPTCCPVPSYSELVRPCYCHRAQMSAGQPSPRFARARSGLSPPGAAGAVGGSCCSEGHSPGIPHAAFLLLLPTACCCLCNHRFLRSAGLWSRSGRVLVRLLASGLLSDTVVSPRSCPSAHCLMGPQNTTHRTRSLLPLCTGSPQTVSNPRAVPGCLLTCSPTALRFQTQKDFFSTQKSSRVSQQSLLLLRAAPRPSPTAAALHSPSLLSASRSHHSHLQLCLVFPFLDSSLLLRLLCMDRGLGCLLLLIFPASLLLAALPPLPPLKPHQLWLHPPSIRPSFPASLTMP